MIESIDLDGLSEEQARFVQDLVEFLRTKAAKKEATPPESAEEIKFRTWPLGVKDHND